MSDAKILSGKDTAQSVYHNLNNRIISLADKNIRVNTISPGIIKTDALNAFPSDSEINILANRTPPSGKSLETTDVAKLVTFLCSEDSYMIRGQNIIIDGGETLLPRI